MRSDKHNGNAYGTQYTCLQHLREPEFQDPKQEKQERLA